MQIPIFHTIDGFFDDPVSERAKALAAEYKTEEHNDISYRGIALTDDSSSISKLESVLGTELDGRKTVYWRRNLAGESSETYIHSDVQLGTFTSIAYLTPSSLCSGGTAFWQHKKYGFVAHPSADQMRALGLPDTPEFWQDIYQDGFDESNWNLLDVAEMKWNRAILFASPRYHSRYPKESFGSSLEDGRLIKVFFLNPKSKFQIRQFDAALDYPDVSRWWKENGWPAVPPESLSTIGFIAHDDKQKFAACWLYLTNSKLAWLEFMVANPDAPLKGRAKAMGKLVEEVTIHAKCLGASHIFATVQSSGLQKLYERHGFHIGDRGATNLIKIL